MRPTPPNPLTNWLSGVLDAKLASLPNDAARKMLLSKQVEGWEHKYRRFIIASRSCNDLPREFFFGAYGWITAPDFAIVIADLSGRLASMRQLEAA